MKSKLSKKLFFNKKTISRLQDHESRAIKGGSNYNTCDCNTDVKTSCSVIAPCCNIPEKAAKNG
jgi:hypothetical protein